ncbi:hypothetical protein HDV05_001092, partial [Chytridiales sp. JEL 0842]
YTLLGSIHSIDQSTFSTIHIEFHDKSQKEYHFSDYFGHTMASLNEHGALFASDPSSVPLNSSSASSNTSVLEFKPRDSWGSTAASWTFHFGMNESVKAIALTGHGPVVATDLKYLRFFTFSGLQTDIRCLPGSVVALVGHGDLLMVVYHATGASHGDQRLEYMLINVVAGTTLKKDWLPMSPKSTLVWVGFSENGMPGTYDSLGVLRVLRPHNDFQWTPVFDSRIVREGKQIYHWPVGFTGEKLICVICKSGDKFPQPPKVLMSEYELKMPMLMSNAPSVVMEQSILLSKMMGQQVYGAWPLTSSTARVDRDRFIERRNAEIFKTTVQLFIETLNVDKPSKALDVARTMTSAKALDGAMKIAVNRKLPALAEKINHIKENLMKAEQMKAAMASKENTANSTALAISTTATTEAPPPVAADVTPLSLTTSESNTTKKSARVTSLSKPIKKEAEVAVKKETAPEPAFIVKKESKRAAAPLPKKSVTIANEDDAMNVDIEPIAETALETV